MRDVSLAHENGPRPGSSPKNANAEHGEALAEKPGDGCMKTSTILNEKKCGHMNPDQTFIGGFDGCVEHMMECEGHDQDSATKICAYIKRRKEGVANTAISPLASDEILLLNREMKGVAEWCQIAPFGRFRGFAEKGNKSIEVIQDLNPKTLAIVAASFQGPLLVDREHRSAEPAGDSEAMAWITALEVRDDGLYGHFEWTDVGRLAVENKRFRYLSPVFVVDEPKQAGEIVTLLGLGSVALTNKPNLRGMKPLRNRVPHDLPNEKNGGVRMTELKKLLGLAEDTEETSVIQAVQTVLNRAKEAETKVATITARAEKAEADLATVRNRVQELELEKLGAEADRFIADNQAVIRNKDEVRKRYLTDKAGTIALVAAMQPAGTTVVLNRADGKTPDATVRNKARDEFVAEVKAKYRCRTNAEAWAIAQRQKPELFAA